MKKQIVIKILLLIFIIFLIACSVDYLDNKNSNTTTNIKLSTNRTTINDLLQSITSFTIFIDAPDITKYSRSFNLGETLSLEIKAGADRTISLYAHNSDGSQMFYAETTVDLEAGTENSVTMILDKLNGLITFDGNGGTTDMDPMYYEDAYTDGFNIFSTVTRYGYIFTGDFNSSSDGTGNLTVHFDGELYNMEFDTNNDSVFDVFIHVNGS